MMNNKIWSLLSLDSSRAFSCKNTNFLTALYEAEITTMYVLLVVHIDIRTPLAYSVVW